MSSPIEIFNRVDTVIQTDVSRASAFYDADNPHRYHVSEIADYTKYFEFFNDDYKYKLFSKIKAQLINDKYYFVRLDEILNYFTKKDDIDELEKVLKYCKIPYVRNFNENTQLYENTLIIGE